MSGAAEHAALAALSWDGHASSGIIWFTAEQAAAAVGADEAYVREVLVSLEAEGLVYRAVMRADAWIVTADGKGEARARSRPRKRRTRERSECRRV